VYLDNSLAARCGSGLFDDFEDLPDDLRVQGGRAVERHGHPEIAAAENAVTAFAAKRRKTGG